MEQNIQKLQKENFDLLQVNNQLIAQIQEEDQTTQQYQLHIAKLEAQIRQLQSSVASEQQKNVELLQRL